MENGCLTCIRGSHKLGRLEHTGVDGQTNADPERVQAVIKAGLEVVPCVMEPGGERGLWSSLRCRPLLTELAAVAAVVFAGRRGVLSREYSVSQPPSAPLRQLYDCSSI